VTAKICLFLLAINIATLLAFRADKAAARDQRRRIPERELLALALFGGTPAAFAARQVFRHKTRKEPFSTYLMLIAALQAGGFIGLVLP
jgi:uncharacterized membrane protein YsdA (DUF1294 family)